MLANQLSYWCISLYIGFSSAQQCNSPLMKPPNQQLRYRIGVLLNRGIATAEEELRPTFVHYLTEAVGRQFDPPISFEMVPVEFGDALRDFQSDSVDFMFANPSVFSCVESESGASSLATLISKRRVGGKEYVLDQFGGVIITKADNDEINSVADIKNKIVGSVSITGLGSGLMQFRVMREAGLHHLQDPKQLIFMKDQGLVVDGKFTFSWTFSHLKPFLAVLDGRLDVGFVRTDQLERSIDISTGSKLDMSRIKIINPNDSIALSDGNDFPFTSSTLLYPEWNFAARPHVSRLVSQKVQQALLHIEDYAMASNLTEQCTLASLEVKSLAQEALSKGHYAGWRPTLSYIQLRLMQEELGVVKGKQCVSSSDIAEAVVCPEGYFRKKDDEIAGGCAASNLDCYGFQCLCSPCVKSYEVEFFHVGREFSCEKFDICGEVEQGDLITFRAVDNKRRDGITMWVRLIYGRDYQTFAMEHIDGSNQYEYTFDANKHAVGIIIMQLYVEDEQVLQSPFRFEVVERDCQAATGNLALESDEYGNCICSGRNVTINQVCIRIEVVVGFVLGVFLVFVAVAGKRYVRVKSREASFWKIPPKELVIPDEPNCLGSGKFGVVLEAKYRGSSVAIKRMFPRKSLSNGATENSPFAKYERSFTDESISFHNQTDTINEPMRKKVLRKELLVISRLRHPCINTVMGVVVDKVVEPILVMELMDTSLDDLLKNKTLVVEGEIILPILQDIARGLRFLHTSEPQILHKDLRPTKILLDMKFRAKLSGFGLSRGATDSPFSIVGTPLYMAPELLRTETPNTSYSDIYAFGVVMTEIFSRRDPFDSDDVALTLREVADPNVNKRPGIPDISPPQIRKLIEDCFSVDPLNRPSAEQLEAEFGTLTTEFIGETNPAKGNIQDLLYQILPSHVADVLRQGKKPEPERFENVTIFFSDIISFTEISSRLDPGKVSDLLDRLYTKFDKLCGQFNIFKVETIGDAYMTVTNLAERQEDHVEIMVRFGHALMKAASETWIDPGDYSLGKVEVRAGIHSGPVVAHVVGVRCPRYSLIGDTVNVASRMESASEPGMLHCSACSAKQLNQNGMPNDLQLIPRGNISIKGRGRMETYFVRHLSGKESHGLLDNSEHSF